MSGMRARGRLLSVVIVGAAVLLAVLLVVAGSVGGTPAGALARNRRAAERDALGLLHLLELPAGARQVDRATLTVDQGSHLVRSVVGSSAQAVGRASWVVPGSQEAVYGYVTSHRPRGASVLSTGSGPGQEMVIFSLPVVPGVIDLRELAVFVSAETAPRSRIAVQSASVWLVPRAASERVPPTTRMVDVTLAHAGGATIASYHLTGASAAAVVSRFDALEGVQPFVINCPMETATGARLVTLTFRASPNGPALARASFTAYAGWGTDSLECNPITFVIGGRSERPLLGKQFFAWLGRVLHTSFAAPRPAGTNP